MSAESPLIKSMRTAVAASPDDVPLRLHLAELLLGAGHGDAAVGEVAAALQHAPGDVQARELMVRALANTPASAPGEAALPPSPQAPVPAQPP
ncbi:tetratricopeptide repeat protein, partial [Streptomyces sp. WAC01526]|uniref:tetratricopeptide repeat protein n=1 Tax=Streptomyces sp. WAC01526 TaxID=2588709 RepID=UPI0011DF797A